ncbi:LysM peptidoglycan-binding domain-containing protein [uncultured Sulfitobacter sp.]|uniref:LysM peptidoglycan-binding domain-containing protein n=1 Tax=uncultured Sulfitobacter sp. TaxID=191468 RepID=UPI00260C8DDC|nr:LysM peptidoglycan-binding domain-containing protein [uncultured Sulfitobacter sp.]
MLNKTDFLGGFAGAVTAGLCMVLLLGLGAFLGLRGSDAPASDDAPRKAVASAGDTSLGAGDAAHIDDPSAKVEAVGDDPSRAQVPRFDELRRETDGTTVIAGRAAPLSDVRVLVDGTEVARAKADDAGGFAAFANLPAMPQPQIVTLSARAGTDETVSADQIILAPSMQTATAQASLPTDAPSDAVPATPGPDPEEIAVADIGPTTTSPAAGALDRAQITTASPTADTAAAPRVAVLQSDAEGVRLLQPAAPQTAAGVALDTIGYSADGAVQLSGRAQARTAQVRVYLDNRAVISLPVDSAGRWEGDLPDVDEGIYTLRVDEVSAQGKVSSRVETPFKRESGQALEAATAAGSGAVRAITVQKGATLWAIARARYGDGLLYVRVFDANADSIRDPDLIYPGQVFDLPQ